MVAPQDRVGLFHRLQGFARSAHPAQQVAQAGQDAGLQAGGMQGLGQAQGLLHQPQGSGRITAFQRQTGFGETHPDQGTDIAMAPHAPVGLGDQGAGLVRMVERLLVHRLHGQAPPFQARVQPQFCHGMGPFRQVQGLHQIPRTSARCACRCRARHQAR